MMIYRLIVSEEKLELIGTYWNLSELIGTYWNLLELWGTTEFINPLLELLWDSGKEA